MTTDPHMQPLPGSAIVDPAPLQPASKPKLKAAVAKQSRERLVLLSMGLITAAAAASCYVLLEYSLASSVLAGGGVWAMLMTAHLQLKKNAEIARLKAELQKFEAARGGLAIEGAASPQPASEAGEGDMAVARSGAARRGPAAKQPAASAQPLSAPGEAGGRTQRAATASQASSTHQNEPQQAQATVGPSGPTPDPRWEATSAGARAVVGRQSSAGAKSRAANDTHQTGGRASAKSSAPQPSGVGSAVVETALWPGTSLSADDPMRDQWAFRPRESGDAQALTDDDGEDAYVAPPAGSSSIDADLEMVQRKIKALADEVNAAEITRDRQPSSQGASQAGGQHSGAPQGSSSAVSASAIEKGIGALKATADSMRNTAAKPPPQKRAQPPVPQAAPPPTQATAAGSSASRPDMSLPQGQALPFELLIPDTAQRIAVSEPPRAAPPPRNSKTAAPARAEPHLPVLDLPELSALEFVSPPPPPNPRLAAIIAAVKMGEMDVFLSPIVALQSHQVSHYDVTVRLKSPHGGYLDNAEQDLQLAGSDVLALFDTARLKRAAILAQRLDAHNKSGSLLSAISGPSITNAEFLETFARVFEERDRISNQLVLTFSQADLEQFSPSAWQALSDMHAFGFRFALSKIDHVDMDFAALAKRGFAFLRLEASALTHGLPARDRFVEANELCQLLAGAGMTLVADTIDDESVRARVFGFGILFGQGRLFGGARQVKLDPLPRGTSAAA